MTTKQVNPLDYLPDFEHFSYGHIQQPQSAKLLAWSKSRECERRLAMYLWVEQNNDQANPQHRVLLNDALSAFLLTFEAAIQHVKDQYDASKNTPPFEQWLAQQPENDELIKGLRTLRHLEAHVQSYPVRSQITVVVGGVPGGSDLKRRWSLQELQASDLQRLRMPKLTAGDLSVWNTLVQSGTTPTLMSQALDQLNRLMLRAESIVL